MKEFTAQDGNTTLEVTFSNGTLISQKTFPDGNNRTDEIQTDLLYGDVSYRQSLTTTGNTTETSHLIASQGNLDVLFTPIYSNESTSILYDVNGKNGTLSQGNNMQYGLSPTRLSFNGPNLLQGEGSLTQFGSGIDSNTYNNITYNAFYVYRNDQAGSLGSYATLGSDGSYNIFSTSPGLFIESNYSPSENVIWSSIDTPFGTVSISSTPNGIYAIYEGGGRGFLSANAQVNNSSLSGSLFYNDEVGLNSATVSVDPNSMYTSSPSGSFGVNIGNTGNSRTGANFLSAHNNKQDIQGSELSMSAASSYNSALDSSGQEFVDSTSLGIAANHTNRWGDTNQLNSNAQQSGQNTSLSALLPLLHIQMIIL